MALDVETAPGGLIRKVQKALGKESQAAVLAPLLYARDGLTGSSAAAPTGSPATPRAAFEFIAEKPKRRHKIRRPPHGRKRQARALAESSVVEILNDDMPFLVDSVLGELQARGLAVRLLLHPIFKTQRDKAGRLQTISGTGDRNWSDGHQESYIAIHLRTLPETEARDLTATLSDILAEVRVVVADWRPMLQRVEAGRAISWRERRRACPPGVLGEAIAFLHWLEAGNFTFLGCALELTRSRHGNSDTGDLVPVDGSGPRRPARSDGAGAAPRQRAGGDDARGAALLLRAVAAHHHQSQCREPRAPARAHGLHRHQDLPRRRQARAARSASSGCSPRRPTSSSPREIPLLRHKVETVLEASGYPAASHAGKALLNVLETFPRDELFQIGAEELQAWSEGILDLETRPRVRVFARVDRFDRFVSVLVYVPRDRYNIARARAHRCAAGRGLQGPGRRVLSLLHRTARWCACSSSSAATTARRRLSTCASWSAGSPRSCAPGTTGWPTPSPRKASERRPCWPSTATAFSAGYAETFPAERALEDIARIERLGREHAGRHRLLSRARRCPRAACTPPSTRFGVRRSPCRSACPCWRTSASRPSTSAPISSRPRFADGERDVSRCTTWCWRPPTARPSTSALTTSGSRLLPRRASAARPTTTASIAWSSPAGADWREVAVLRAYAAYLRQLGSPFGPRYIADTLTRHAGVARDLLELFHLRFDPHRGARAGQAAGGRGAGPAAHRRRACRRAEPG